MMSHYLSKIYNRQILLESIFDESFKNQLIEASGDSWYLNHQLKRIGKIYSDDEQVYDAKSLEPMLDYALKHAKHMYGNLQRLVRDAIMSEENQRYPWLTSTTVDRYIDVCKSAGETDAPVALEYYEFLFNSMMQSADSLMSALNQDKKWTALMNAVASQYLKTFGNGKRVMRIEHALNLMLREYMNAADESEVRLFDSEVGMRNVRTYVDALQERWPMFEQVIERGPRPSYNMRFAMEDYKEKFFSQNARQHYVFDYDGYDQI